MTTSQLGVIEWKIYCGYIRRKASCFVFSHREHRKPSKKGGYKCHTTGWRKISWKKVVCSRHSKVNDLKRTLAGKIHVLFCNQELLFRVQQYIKMGKDKNIFCVSHWSFFYFSHSNPRVKNVSQLISILCLQWCINWRQFLSCVDFRCWSFLLH